MKIKPFEKLHPLFVLLSASLLLLASCKKEEAVVKPKLPTPVGKYEFTAAGDLKLSWNKVIDGNDSIRYFFDLRLKTMPANSFLTYGGNATFETTKVVSANFLYPATTYQGFLHASPYGPDMNKWIQSDNYTIEFTTPCTPIAKSWITDITANGALLSWLSYGTSTSVGSRSDIPSFNVYLRKKGTTSAETIATTDQYLKLENLASRTTYEVNFSYFCTQDNKMYDSGWHEFTTL